MRIYFETMRNTIRQSMPMKPMAPTQGKYSVIDYYEKACSWAIEHQDSIQKLSIFIKQIWKQVGEVWVSVILKTVWFIVSLNPRTLTLRLHFTIFHSQRKKMIPVFKNSVAYQGELNRSFYEGSPSHLLLTSRQCFIPETLPKESSIKNEKEKKGVIEISSNRS